VDQDREPCDRGDREVHRERTDTQTHSSHVVVIPFVVIVRSSCCSFVLILNRDLRILRLHLLQLQILLVVFECFLRTKHFENPTISYFLQELFRGGTPFPLLKCIITHYGRHCEPFSLLVPAFVSRSVKNGCFFVAVFTQTAEWVLI